MLSPHPLHESLNWTADHFPRLFFLGGLFGLLVFCVVFGLVWLFAVFLNGS